MRPRPPYSIARDPSARTSYLYRTLAFSGADRLADLELVAAVLSGEEAKRRQRAESLLADVGSLWGLLRIGVEALTELGLSPSEALRLSAALELGRRALIEPATRTAVREPVDAYRCVAPLLLGTPRERFLVVVLDVKNRPRHIACVTEGSVDTCAVDPREVFGPALRERGSARGPQPSVRRSDPVGRRSGAHRKTHAGRSGRRHPGPRPHHRRQHPRRRQSTLCEPRRAWTHAGVAAERGLS
jgi:DNA repair protein RadC